VDPFIGQWEYHSTAEWNKRLEVANPEIAELAREPVSDTCGAEHGIEARIDLEVAMKPVSVIHSQKGAI
jgi:hypothetical protein